MKKTDNELDALLDEAVASIRQQEPSAEVADAAGRRVLEHLQAEGAGVPSHRLESCADFQALIPAYLAGELSEPRRLLVEDHTRSCIPCRRALTAARSGQAAVAAPVPVRGPSWTTLPAVRWAAAAVFVLGLGLAGFWTVDHFVIQPNTVMASVDRVDGSLLGLGDEGNAQLTAGEPILFAQPIRTAKGSRAVVRLEDGSLVELNERSEISLVERRGGTSIQVARGSVIVQAADQREGHLFATTDDCLVSVTGTVFAVTSGTKGSRVSVIEGEVHVDDGRTDRVLHPGDQVSTHTSLSAVPLAQEVAWSGDVDTYLALLEEISEVRRELMAAVRSPELRYSTDLLDLVPAEPIFVGGLPNIAEGLSEGYGNVLARIQESEMLSRWWAENVDPEMEADMSEAVDRIRDFGQYVGEEIVIAARAGHGQDEEGFVVLGWVDRPAAFRTFLQQQIDGWSTTGEDIRLVNDPAAAVGEDVFWIWVDDDGLMGLSSDGDVLREVGATYSGSANPFVGTEFHSVLAEAYGRGAGWLFGIDLQAVFEEEMEGDEDRATFESTGFSDLRHVLVERKPDGDGTLSEAVFTFGEERHGVASWLAPPAPMGSLEYVSADARFAAASVFKEPSLMLEDLFRVLETEDSEFWQQLAEFEAESGLSIEADIAAPLGGEMTVALDGPIVPQPAWKVIIEVYDPVRLQQTLEQLVLRLNAELAEHDTEVSLSEETVGGRTYFTLSSSSSPQDLCYTYHDGYLVGSPNRVLTEQALAIRESGYTLTDSPDFVNRLPRSSHADFSALVYNDLGALMSHATSLLGGVAEGFSQEQQSRMQALLESTEPSLFCAYGEADRIVIASTGDGGWMSLPMSALLGSGAGIGLEELLEQAANQGI